MTGINVEFKFEIGDLVYIKGTSHDFDHRPNQFLIVERLVQQCHGGIQLLYKLLDRTQHHPEIVLTREQPAYKSASDAAYEERRKKNEVDREHQYDAWKRASEKVAERDKDESEVDEK